MSLFKQDFTGAYNKIAKDFSDTRKKDWGEFDFFKEYIQGNILDLGCGNGRIINFLSDNGTKKSCIFGMDSSASLLEIAQKKYPECRFIHGKMEKGLLFESESLDRVFMIASFHHLLNEKDRLKTLNEIHRILKKDGILIMTNWNLWYQKKYKKERKMACWRSFFLPSWHKNDLLIPFGKNKIKRFYHAFSEKELGGLLKKSFFEQKKSFFTRHNEKVDKKEGYNLCTIARKISRKKIAGVNFDLISSEEALNKMFNLAHNEVSNFSGSEQKNCSNTKEKANEENTLQNKHNTISEQKSYSINKQFHIATPNPEMCIEASHSTKFKKVINNVDLSLADGSGIIWAEKYQPKNLTQAIFSLLKFFFSAKKIGHFTRSRGSDLFRQFCANSQAKIFLLGGAEGVAEKCAKTFGGENFVGTDGGSAEESDDERIINKINKSEAVVLFVAFGAPRQEFWINRNLKKLKNIRFAMGVGGSFDFVVGKQIRAPHFMQKMGLEWLYRLIREPARFKRIYNATIKFIILVIRKNH